MDSVPVSKDWRARWRAGAVALVLAVCAATCLNCAHSGTSSSPYGRYAPKGEASWYGPGFHGRTTASGEVFDQRAMTAAHKTLAFGTRVRVTNAENGRSVTVRINDRFPGTKGRVIDLSEAAFEQLAPTARGVIPVTVEVLGR